MVRKHETEAECALAKEELAHWVPSIESTTKRLKQKVRVLETSYKAELERMGLSDHVCSCDRRLLQKALLKISQVIYILDYEFYTLCKSDWDADIWATKPMLPKNEFDNEEDMELLFHDINDKIALLNPSFRKLWTLCHDLETKEGAEAVNPFEILDGSRLEMIDLILTKLAFEDLDTGTHAKICNKKWQRTVRKERGLPKLEDDGSESSGEESLHDLHEAAKKKMPPPEHAERKQRGSIHILSNDERRKKANAKKPNPKRRNSVHF